MSRRIALFVIEAMPVAENVQAAKEPMRLLHCSCHNDYDVQIAADGVAITRDNGQPQRVFMRDGKSRVDNRDVPVSDADAGRLREYQQQMHALVPAIGAIERDGLQVGYAALTATDNVEERERLLKRLHDQHAETMQHVDKTLVHGLWLAEDDQALGNRLQEIAADLASDVTRDVVRDALSGDSSTVAALQARVGALETTLDKAVSQPVQKLGERASALRPRLGRLEQPHQQCEFRVANDERLRLMSFDRERPDKASQYAPR